MGRFLSPIAEEENVDKNVNEVNDGDVDADDERPRPGDDMDEDDDDDLLDDDEDL